MPSMKIFYFIYTFKIINYEGLFVWIVSIVFARNEEQWWTTIAMNRCLLPICTGIQRYSYLVRISFRYPDRKAKRKGIKDNRCISYDAPTERKNGDHCNREETAALLCYRTLEKWLVDWDVQLGFRSPESGRHQKVYGYGSGSTGRGNSESIPVKWDVATIAGKLL